MEKCCLGKNPSPEHFGRWCKKRDIFLHPDVAFLVQTKTMGCGVFAKKPLPAGTVVIECPAAASVSPYVEPSAESPSIAVLQSADYAEELKADPVLFVVLRLMAELCRAAATTTATPWRPWLEACPRMREHLYYLRSAEELAAFGLSAAAASSSSPSSGGPTEAAADGASSRSSPSSPPSSSGAVTVRPASWTGISQQLRDMRALERWAAVQRFIAAHPSLWPPATATFDLFCECMAQVSSRNFHREEVQGREGPYLLPGLDIINHSFEPNCDFEMRGGGRKHATSFTVVAARPLQRGEQIYCSYGHIGVARFAVEFQFTTPLAVHEDIVRLSAETLVHMAAWLRTTGGAESAESAERVVPAAEVAEMSYRVERLQRLGILFDEGLYLLQPVGLDPAQARNPEERSRVAALNTRREDGVAEALRLLFVVASLLLHARDRPAFEQLYHTISKEWVPPALESGGAARGLAAEKAELKRWAKALLAAKGGAAMMQRASVDAAIVAQAVDGAAAEKVAAGRRRLVREVLRSEMAVLDAYADLVDKQ